MHMVVFGWFGASAVWFLPLLWRLVKSLLPDGGGLRGPGTIRLWVGFFCVLMASCTMEAVLFHSFAFASGMDRVGRALLSLFSSRDGVISTSGALTIGGVATVIFLVALPWLCDFTWRQALGWANGSFGLGLDPAWFVQREKSNSDRSVSRSSSRVSGSNNNKASKRTAIAPQPRTSHDAPALGLPTATQREGGRYQRPTVWRPPPARGSAKAQQANGREASRPVGTPGMATANKETTSPRESFAEARKNGVRPSRSAVSIEPMEPVAPIGWLKREVAATPPRVSAVPAPVKAPARPVPPAKPQPLPLPPIAAATPPVTTPVVSSQSFFASTNTPAAMPAEPPVPDDIQQTLRSIAQTAAQWTSRSADIAKEPVEAVPVQTDRPPPIEKIDAPVSDAIEESLPFDHVADDAPVDSGPEAPLETSPVTETPSAESIAGTYSSSMSLHDGYTFATGAQTIVRETTVANASASVEPSIKSGELRQPVEIPPPVEPSAPPPFNLPTDEIEPQPLEASNVVQFPRALAAVEPPIATREAAAKIPSPAITSTETKPPIRGFIATEFEFHAPSASAVDLPGLDLLESANDEIEPVSEQHLQATGQLIEQRLQEFKVPVTVVGASAGPVITRFEVEPALGVRGSQIVGLMKDLSRGLGLTSIRVVETIPGKTCMGLELPNARRQMIRLSEILESDAYRDSKSYLTIAMGKDIVGNPVVTDLARAPHMLVAGTTGSGKSVAINAMILSLLYKAKPEDVRLIMIDPKMLELSVYEGIPHLLAPVVTDMKLAANALNWCVGEMEKRYKLMSAVGVRNLQGFNQKVRNADAAGKKLTNPFSLTPDAPEPLSKLPMIVVVIDELADLMMVAGKQIEQLIARLAQKARAAGIHLILATQRPSVDVITGLIKANIPTRVAFQVSSKIDSRTILDQMGAESLLGAGDMLFLPPGTGYPQRIHGAFVADEEVHSVVEYLKQFGEPEYEEGILSGPTPEGGTPDMFGDTPADAEADPLYDEAVSFVLRTRRASISSVQRQLRIGYNRAARLVEQMETAGLVSSMGTNGNREVLAPPQPE